MRYLLKEVYSPPKLPIYFSREINNEIETIKAYNENNIEAIKQWQDYLIGMKSYISCPAIAWDNMGRYPKLRNNYRVKYINDFDYNVGLIIKTNMATNQTYVVIFKANLNPEEFGLIVPPNINENKKTNQIISEVINQYLKENLLLAS